MYLIFNKEYVFWIKINSYDGNLSLKFRSDGPSDLLNELWLGDPGSTLTINFLKKWITW